MVHLDFIGVKEFNRFDIESKLGRENNMLVENNLDSIVSDIIKYRRVGIRLETNAYKAKRHGIPLKSEFYCSCIQKADGVYDIVQFEDNEKYTWGNVDKSVLENLIKLYTEIELEHNESIHNFIGVMLGVVDDIYEEDEAEKTDGAVEETESKLPVKLPSKQSEDIEKIKEALIESNDTHKEATTIQIKPRVGPGCVKCRFTGWITVDEKSGFSVKCDCQVREETKAKETKVVIASAIKDKEKLRGLIPLERRKDEYDSEIVKNRVKEISANQNCRIYNFDNFDSLMNTILSEVSTGTLKHSYILGAPNGFGKTTFVYTAIKRIVAREGKAVPYIALSELALEKVNYEEKLVERLKNPRFGMSKKEDNEYDWADYLNADVLFTYLSSIDSKTLESMILSAIVCLRGTKGLPTVVMTSASIAPYKNDLKLKKYYWDEMLDYGGKLVEAGYDRLIHKSCFKLYDNPMQVVKGVDY